MIDIYVHTCRVTGKRYVGQSCSGMEYRWKGHCGDAGKRNLAFANAIRKHGPESFEHRLLMQCETQDEADDMEDFFIQELKTMAPNGYNLRGGGKNGYRHSEETRRKMSAARKGRKLSEEHRRNLSAARKGQKGQKGRKLSEEHRRNISDSLKGRKLPPFSAEHRQNMSAAAKLRAAKKRQSRNSRSNILPQDRL